ncbi:hypothetical protein ACROYT_G000097 [Oculina patagonica]
MAARSDDVASEGQEGVERRTSSRSRKPNTTLDQDGVLGEKLHTLKNTRRGPIASVSVRVNEIVELIMDDRNLQEVKEKLLVVENAFLQFQGAHSNYAAEVQSAEDKVACEEYLRVDSEIKPENSVSNADFRTPSRISRTSRRSSRASSRASRSSSSSLLVARAKEAARVAELKAERAMLDKRQALEEQKFRLKLEETRLNLEAEIAKTAAKEQVLAAMVDSLPAPLSVEPIKRENAFRVREELKPSPIADQAKLNPKAPDWPQPPAINRVCEIRPTDPKIPVTSGGSFDDGIKLQQQQSALQLQQTKIIEMLATNQNKSRLPQPLVPTFQGNLLEYRSFIRAFESLIEHRTSSSTERLYYLEQYTAGDVKELVRSCHHLSPDQGYQEARRLLKKTFGDEYRIASAYESKALNWPTIKVEDGKVLNRFAIYLAGCKNAMEGSQYSSKFDQPDSFQKLILKLPFNMRERWRRVVDEIMEHQKRPVKFDDVVIHSLEDCKSLRSRPYQERIQFLASKSLCFGCLSDKHVAKDCPQRKSCKFTSCPRKHPTVLHTQPRETSNSGASSTNANTVNGAGSTNANTVNGAGSTNANTVNGAGSTNANTVNGASSTNANTVNGAGSTNANTINESATQIRNGMVSIDATLCGLTGAGSSKIGMAIVPVKVKCKGSDTTIVTYAFLDNGSSSTFCTESLMRQLGVNGLETKISLTTLEKKDSLIDSFIVQDLVISDLDENNFIPLPVLYTRTEIPVAKEDIPTQEDIDQWPRLNGVYLPSVSAEIGLLIASDVPEALDSLEVKNSQDGGPYASRTRIGWVVNGPLRRHHQGPRAASFFVEVDTELQEMVEGFYNRDFSESIADSKTELSQDERRFMKSVEESIKLNDSHYEISLPFKDQEYPVPNNRIQAEQRAIWLKRKLEKNPQLLDDYKAFVEDIVAKGYARRVPAYQRESSYERKTWFIPHHGVYHPHKPGKIRVVFDCSAKFKGKSLNDLLLKGPDLTNSLFGVLTRFRQERVAVMADIEAMFHQFSVDRCLKPVNFGAISSSQLHHFSDASEIGFGSVSYLRLIDESGIIHCTFLQAKSRLVPLKQVTIPRLELSAATVSVRLDKVLKSELELPLTKKSIFWTDSMSVLRYVKNESKRFHTFVANRIAVIRDGSNPDQWRHISGDLNPSDDLSRGLSAETLLNCERWTKEVGIPLEGGRAMASRATSLGSIPDADPEVKLDATVNLTSATEPSCPLITMYSSYNQFFQEGYGNIILPDDSGDESDDESSQESEQSSQDSQSSEEIDSSQEEKEDIDPWSRIQDEVTSRHEAKLEALINEYEQHGDSSEVARVKAENALLPVYRKELRKVLLDYLQWMHAMKKDSTFRKVIETKNELKDTEGYDWLESTELAIDKRKFLLNRLFVKQTVPED